MGGDGSGRKPDWGRKLIEKKTNIGMVGSEPMFLPDYSGVAAHDKTNEHIQSIVGDYLPLIGGTLTGDLILQDADLKLKDLASGKAWTIQQGSSGNIFNITSPDGANILQLNNSSKLTTLDGSLSIGGGAAGTDYTLTFNGETTDGIFKWMEDEDYFQSSDKWVFDLGWDASAACTVTLAGTGTQVTGLNINTDKTNTGSFTFSTGGVATATMSANQTVGTIRGYDCVAGLKSTYTATGGVYIIDSLYARGVDNSNSHSGATVYSKSLYCENPPTYTGTAQTKWAAVFAGDTQVEDNFKLILGGSLAAKGDSYFVWDTGGATLDCFVAGAEVWNADGTTLTILDAVDIQSSLKCDSIANDTGLAAGTYTATRSAEVNLDSNVSLSEGIYMRVGNVVTVTIVFTADPTLTATTTSFEISLPIASNFTAGDQLAGTAFCGNIASMGAQIASSAANNTAKITWKATDITSQSWFGTFTYRVI